MKKLFTVLCIAFSLFTYCNGQAIKLGEFDIQYTLDYRVYDSTKGLVAYQKKDSGWVILDSAATINVLVSSIKRMQDERKELYAATSILEYVNTQGYVLNKDLDKFNSAVERYFKVCGNKNKFKKMQPIDILVLDKKGSAVGWVSQ